MHLKTRRPTGGAPSTRSNEMAKVFAYGLSGNLEELEKFLQGEKYSIGSREIVVYMA